VDVVLDPGEAGREGPGTYHYVAVRVPDEESLYEWRELFAEQKYDVSRVKDCHYPHSLYVREPSGVLFELATEPRGLAPSAGDAGVMSLQEWVKTERELVERQLPTLQLPE